MKQGMRGPTEPAGEGCFKLFFGIVAALAITLTAIVIWIAIRFTLKFT